MRGGVNLICRIWYERLTTSRNVELPYTTIIGAGIQFPHNFPVVINGAAVLGKNVIIHPNTLIGGSRNKKGAPKIGNNVFIGNGAKIVGNCKIGNWVFISPSAMITKDIPDNSVVGYGLNKLLQVMVKN